MMRETWLFYVLPPLLSFILIHPLIWAIRKIAWRWQVIDRPNLPRKIHKQPIPLLGGVAIWLAFILLVFVFYKIGWLVDDKVSARDLFVIALASLALIIGGVLDDKYNLPPRWQFIWPVIASIIVIAGGIQVGYVTNPWGGIFYLDKIQINWGGAVFYPLAQLLAFVWLLGMIYTTKFLDGLDGLVSGITTIGALIIFIVSLSWDIPWSATSVLALIVAGLFAGFFVWNFYPAKIFLGEGGSTLAGFLLGVLAIISGSKIATTLLVMGLPILDVAWVIVRRWREKRSPTEADRKHLHFRLLDAGFSHSQAVLFLLLTSAVFGSFGLFQSTKGKLLLLSVLAVYMAALAYVLLRKYRKSGLTYKKN